MRSFFELGGGRKREKRVDIGSVSLLSPSPSLAGRIATVDSFMSYIQEKVQNRLSVTALQLLQFVLPLSLPIKIYIVLQLLQFVCGIHFQTEETIVL